MAKAIPPDELDAIFEKINADNAMREKATRAGLERINAHKVRTEEDDFNNTADIEMMNNHFDKMVVQMGATGEFRPRDSGDNPDGDVGTGNLDLYLFEISTLGRWDKVRHEKPRMMAEMNVFNTECIMTGMMEVPFEGRRVTTPRFFLSQLKFEGLFTDVRLPQVITHTETGNTFLICSTVSKRMNPQALLVGNYIFRLEPESAVADQPDQGGITKVLSQGSTVLRRRAIFMNFFFDIIQHHVSEPLVTVAL